MSFIVFGLPRSRTTWLSVFLTHGPTVCVHDAVFEAASLEVIHDLLNAPDTGLSETGLAHAWPVLRARHPDLRAVVVRRDIDQVRTSLARFAWHFLPGHLEAIEAQLEEISADPLTLTVTFDDLATEAACRAVFEHCLQRPFDHGHWLRLKDQIIQIDMAERTVALLARRDQIGRLSEEIGALSGAVTFQREPWPQFWADGQPLFEAHYREAGPIENLPFDPPVELAEAADRMGLLAIMTARRAGIMIGYVLFHLEPSWECRRVLQGVQSAFYVAPGHRGLGPLLHAFALKHLRTLGVKRLILRAGVRAAGPKLAAFYRRLGAEDDGQLFSLRIGGNEPWV